MADGEKQLKVKVTKLYDALREQQAKCYAITEEIGKILRGDPGIGDDMKAAREIWQGLWSARYRGDYVWTMTREMPQLKRILQQLGLVEFEQRAGNYLSSTDPYYAQSRHSFGLFTSQVNRFATAGTPTGDLGLEVDAPADCKHAPRCKTDQEHTRRRSEDLRA